MVSMRVSVNTKGVLKYLETIQKKQVPYATSQALNSTIFDVRKQIVGPTYRRAFNVRNSRFASAAFRVEKASKRRLRAKLFDRLERGSLDLHAEGGTKRPKSGSLAIPTDKIKRTSGGKIPKGKKPRNLAGGFVGNPFGKGRGIWQRDRRTRRLKLMYDLERSARIRRSFDFYRDAEKVASRVYPRHWEREFIWAIRKPR